MTPAKTALPISDYPRYTPANLGRANFAPADHGKPDMVRQIRLTRSHTTKIQVFAIRQTATARPSITPGDITPGDITPEDTAPAGANQPTWRRPTWRRPTWRRPGS